LVVIISGLNSRIYSQDVFFRKYFSDFCLTASLNYVASASIQLNPNNADLIERNSTTDLSGGYGYGFSLKKRIFGDDVFLGISTEYIKITDDQLTDVVENANDFQTVRVTETLEMIPIEMSIYFNIPKFMDNLNVYLGGGAGFYFGDRTRRMVGMQTKTLSKDPMFSLNVLFGSEYRMNEHVSLNFEVKVRDGSYKVHNQFPTDRVLLDNRLYFFEPDLNSRVYIDGLKLSFGIGYNF
jgi:hypothetical protein